MKQLVTWLKYVVAGTILNSWSWAGLPAHGQTTSAILRPGELALVGYTATGGAADWAFVPLVNLAPNTQIRFTNNGWLAAGGFRTGEAITVYTAPSYGTPKGRVVTYSSNQAAFSGPLPLAASGDQLLAYQGSDQTPTFVAGLTYGTSAWSDATSNATSALPTGLLPGISALALPVAPTAIYSATRTGSPDALRTALYGPANFPPSTSRGGYFGNDFTFSEGEVPDAVELQALRDFYQSTHGDQWYNRKNWPATDAAWASATVADVATWAGMGVANGDVTSLDFFGNGTSGQLLPSIGQLRGLRTLHIERSVYCCVDAPALGGTLPPELGQLQHLQTLSIRFTEVSGSLPPQLGQLHELRSLDLMNNHLSGRIPPELGQLQQLTYLVLDNYYKGAIIFSGHLNAFVGGIPPELGQLTNLTYLALDMNPLGGTLPPQLQQLTQLTFLELDDSQLSGAVPVELLRLPALQTLVLGAANYGYQAPNTFSQLPAPDLVPNLAGLKLVLERNQFSFETLEPYFSGPGQMKSAPGSTYLPQTLPITEQIITRAQGQALSLPSGIGGAFSHYQWQRGQTDGSWQDLSAATGAAYQVASTTPADAGSYRCQVINDLVTGLTLTSPLFTVQVSTLALPPDKPDSNLDRNWTLERSFDGDDNVVAESKQFTDGLGRPTQAQARNAATKQVFAAQTIYNTGGQPVLQTLAAPTYNQSFNYKQDFVTAGGTAYGTANFEQGKASAPDAVDATAIGTLGYYFSKQNSQEPLTPVTGYPYSLVEPYDGPLGGTRRAAGPGDEFRMGKGREGKGHEFPVRKEFDDYLRRRPQFVPGSPNVTLQYQAVKSVSVNADGRESIVVSNKEGQALISCLSGPQYPAQAVFGYISSEATNPYDPDAPAYQDIHIPAAGPQDVKFTMGKNTPGGRVLIVNLLTDDTTSYAIHAATAGVEPERHVTLAPGFYRFVSVTGTQWSSYDAHYGNFSYSYYDDAGRVIATVAPNGLTSGAAGTPTFTTRNTYDTSGRLLATESADEGRSEYVYAQDGRIRFSQSALQRPAGRFSYSHYDEVGRVVESGEYTPAVNPSPTGPPPTTGSGFQSPQYGAWQAPVATTNGVTYPNCCVGSLDKVGQYVELTVQAPQAGTYSLTLNYASGNPDRTMSLLVNGALASQLTFPRTDSYQWKTYLNTTASVTLQAGTNRIRLEYRTGDSGGVNLAYLQFTGSAAATAGAATYPALLDQLPTATATTGSGFQSPQYGAWQAPVATTNGVTYPNCCVGSLDKVGQYVELTVQAPQAGTYSLTLNYASGNPDRTMSLLVNGALASQLTFPRTDSYQWKTYLNTTASVTLQAGTNRIRLEYRAGDSGGVNLAYLQFTGSAAATTNANNLIEERAPTNSLASTRCAQRNQVWYDLAFDGTVTKTDGTIDPNYQNGQLNGRHQEFVVGAVAKTRNDNVTTWYSYDELGRVTWVVQDIKGVGVKTLDYQYDFSGNVLQVAYQKGQSDSFYHYYTYDAAQRLTVVNTSPDGVAKIVQAAYSYYLHGPLKRVQVAGDLQGVDYVYTLQGALKSINHATSALEPGHDSPATNGVQKDLFALTLEYFSGDYRSGSIDVLAPPLPPVPGTPVADRYDGTIRSASWRTAASPDIQRLAYTYDEKSQLQNSTYSNWRLINKAYQLNTASTNNFQEGGLRYDLNGNIQSLQRTGATGAVTDNFSYTYKPNTNQLAEVHTGSASGAKVLDYDYDELGQMTRQRDEQGQRYFTYDVTGKTTGVYLDVAHQQPVVTYAYDDRGFRVSKTAYPPGGVPAQTTYYVRDVAGNILTVYAQAAPAAPVQRTEVPLYGSGRLGTLTHLDDGSDDYRYELTDHLGNARVVFHRPTTNVQVETMELGGVTPQAAFLNDDRYRVAVKGAPSGDYVARLTDSQPAGQELKRVLTVTRGDTITFSALAQWKQNAAAAGSGATPFVLVGAAAGVNALSQRGAAGQENPYATNNSNWLSLLAAGLGFTIGQGAPAILGATSLEGWLKYRVLDTQGNPMLDAQGQPLAGVDYLLGTGKWEYLQTGVRVPQDGTIEVMAGTSGTGEAVYFDNLRVEQTGGLIVQEQHQYAYGSPLPGLSYTVGTKRYRYGYQGQFAEHDEETAFESFELRLYNSRVGRWLNTDPEGQFSSPYVGMGNNPVSGVDPDGRWSYLASAAVGMGVGAAAGGIIGYQQGGKDEIWGGIALGAVVGGMAGGIAHWGLNQIDLTSMKIGGKAAMLGAMDIMQTAGLSSSVTIKSVLKNSQILKTDFFGTTVYGTEMGDMKYGAAMTLPGIGIFVNPNDMHSIDLLRHEFGHIQQAKIWGKSFYYGTIAPLSILDASKPGITQALHQQLWTEWTANRLSFLYFKQPSDWNFYKYPTLPAMTPPVLLNINPTTPRK